MKAMKKILALLLVAAMVMAMGITAFADDLYPAPGVDGKYSLAIKKVDSDTDKDKHQYVAYQIFKGTVAAEKVGDSDNINYYLADIEWGDNVVDVQKLAIALNASFPNEFPLTGNDAPKTAADFAKIMAEKVTRTSLLATVIAANVQGTPVAELENKGDQYSAMVPGGAYLVRDKDVNPNPVAEANRTRFILTVVGDVEIEPKAVSQPTFSKTVADWNDSIASNHFGGYDPQNVTLKEALEDFYTWHDTADHDIGDTVPYKLSVALPAGQTLSSYTSYKIRIADTMSVGLTFDPNSLVGFIGIAGQNNSYKRLEFMSKDEFDEALGNSQDTANLEANYLWYQYIKDEHGDDTLTIGSENLLPMIGMDTESNAIYTQLHLFYTCTLNENAKIGTEGNPNTAGLKYSNDPSDLDSFGNTPDDKAVVYTMKLHIKKTDEQGTALNGADFTLEKFYLETVSKKGMTYVTVNADQSLSDPIVVDEDSAGQTLKNVWVLVEDKDKNELDPITNELIKTEFNFVGLDDGRYKLTETVAPAGYNKLKVPVVFDIITTHDTLSGLKSVAVSRVSGPEGLHFHTSDDVDGDAGTVASVDGVLTSSIVNVMGVELPSTGGVGTTMFYIIGGLMCFGAAVLLITKKRMSAN